MRLVSFLTLVVACTSNTGAVSVEEACARGQQALSGFHSEPESLATYWDWLDDTHIAVVVRRVSTIDPPAPLLNSTVLSDPVFIGCVETARFEVVDGLGWIEDSEIEIAGFTGRGYFGSPDGTPSEEQYFISDFFFEEDLGRIPTDEAEHLLILQVIPDGRRVMQWRATVTDGMASGARTVSGEPISIETFRRDG